MFTIAAGIVLAVLVLAYLPQILTLVGWLILTVIGLILIGLLCWALSPAAIAIGTFLTSVISIAAPIAGVVALIALTLAGFWALSMVFYSMFWVAPREVVAKLKTR